MLLTMFLSGVVSGQQKPTTGYAPVNGLKMYYEVHGSGDPVLLVHGSFMTITNNWTGWISELSKTRKVIAVEMQVNLRVFAQINEALYKVLRHNLCVVIQSVHELGIEADFMKDNAA